MSAAHTLALISLPALILALIFNTFRVSPSSITADVDMEVYPGDNIIPSPEMLVRPNTPHLTLQHNPISPPPTHAPLLTQTKYTHSLHIPTPPSTIFPYILQLGATRGGWPLPRSWERFLPKSMHATRSINPAFTDLKVGDVVKDYGFNEAEDVFVVADVVYPGARRGLVGGSEEANAAEWERGLGALVYRSERNGTVFTWSLVVRDVSGGGGYAGEGVNGGQQRDGDDDGNEGSRRQANQPMSLVTLRFRGRIQRTGWQRKLLVWGGGWMDWATTWPMLRGLRERCVDEYRRR